MDSNANLKVFLGAVMILLFGGSFSQSNSFLDLLFLTMGVMVFTSGFYVNYTNNPEIGISKSLTYFLFMFCINGFQWIISIYILFINQFHVAGNVLIVLAIAPIMTIYLIRGIFTNDLEKDNNNVSGGLDKRRLSLLSGGIIMVLLSLMISIEFKYLLALFVGLVGVMIFIYGFYFENKKFSINLDYAQFMACVIVVQWIFLIYIWSYATFNLDDFVLACAFLQIITLKFYIQIRESDLEYIGRYKKR